MKISRNATAQAPYGVRYEDEKGKVVQAFFATAELLTRWLDANDGIVALSFSAPR